MVPFLRWIPLLSLFRFACMASRVEGPDLPARVVTPTSVLELGAIGKIALSGKTIGDALAGVAAALPFHTTHEMMATSICQHGIVMREAWGIHLDDETRHFAQQYVAALIQSLCDPFGMARPVFSHMAIVAHPVHGVAHLRPWFGEGVVASTDGALLLHIPDSLAVRPAGFADRVHAQSYPLPDVPLPRGAGSLIPSAEIVIAAMLNHGTPTVERLAVAAGQSVRTLQRRLAEEGTSFSGLIEDVRRTRAMAQLAGGHLPAGDIAASLGYQRQSSLTRAVRRWSGMTPQSMRPKRGRPVEVL
jgi:AraC-like DNA-binding protein